uniref:Protein tramtrack, beta isoform n=1 Tax=Sipha flava TaxID=143950 RepID=A0A2S2QR72_9HEMI
MGSEHYCLRWNNHQNNLLGVFSQLLQEESLVDVTLACSEEGRLIRAHKVVLSACSAYFKALFLDHPTRHPIVVLKDVQFAELRDLVEFMYRGEVNVDHRQLTTLLKTAESLKVKGLADMARPSDGDEDTVGDRVELLPADRDDEPMEPEDLRPLSRCRTPVPTESRTPSPPPTESDDNLSMQSEPSDMTTVDRHDRPSPSGSGLPPVQQVPLFLKKEADCDKTDDRSIQGESSSEYRSIPDPEREDKTATDAVVTTAALPPRYYTCMYCNLTFPHQSKLTRHILSHSLDNPPGGGSISFTDPGGGGVLVPPPSALSLSLLSSSSSSPQTCNNASAMDDGGGGTLCKFCGKTFPDVATLVGHLPVHTGDRPFKCEFCGKAFKLRHHMKDHCRVHTGERPFRCALCGKTFSRSTILKAHEKTHYPKFTGRHRFLSSPSPEEEPGGDGGGGGGGGGSGGGGGIGIAGLGSLGSGMAQAVATIASAAVRPFDLTVIQHHHRHGSRSPPAPPPPPPTPP